MKVLSGVIVILSLYCAAPMYAQTTICSNDTVVLKLNGYLGGAIQWHQSSDKISWMNVSGTQSGDSLTLLPTQTTRYYRAMVTNGTCGPLFSDTSLVLISPTTPIAKPATNILPLSFRTNWSQVPEVTYYYIDVSTDENFTTFIPGYHMRQVKQDTNCLVGGVQCNVQYFYRVRALGDACTVPGEASNTISVTTIACPPVCRYKSTCSGEITDARDGKTYKTIQIGTQCWMAQNLNVGTAIPAEVLQTPGIIEKYCYGYTRFNIDSSKCATRGGLYLWAHMMAYGVPVDTAPGPHGVCPAGWHIPVDSEWMCLEQSLGAKSSDVAYASSSGGTLGQDVNLGGNLKDTVSWGSPNLGATNSTGFSAIPGGARTDVSFLNPGFVNRNISALWWTATKTTATSANTTYFWFREIYSGSNGIGRKNRDFITGQFDIGYDYEPATYGLSVRCVKD